ncbi:phosphate/phosphite/phosphonate ABC transporter substrate-binding protein [Arthrobacter crystallopoietes]|uniref:Phosphonate transport system substrate-binding protein n=1 Tax=Crystallibacter crystallopoietes TaxID=37928 RepID=A0A1H1AU38_9MICC|nr:phosphate/phosphite/phosphonate ABC transporter substrate-binding protein [Arthrobacter crystallopoietes]AUI51395.1 phosphonate ABC transporter substrate-binding protein [Arthrobacter crystallopoietes]SDQ43258.1 phosphonate transport system substrate-binding protein [Arthrobacter crystallopoietes]
MPSKPKLKPLAFLSLAAASLTLTACGASSDAAEAGTASATCPGGAIQFGIEPYEDPAKLEPAYRVLANALAEELDCPVNVQVVEDYAAEVLAMRNGKLQLGQFGPLGYVFASQQANAEPLASFGTSDGELSGYTGGIWVPKDSPIQTVEDLRGKDLALGSVGSTSGDVLPRFALREAGIEEAELNMNYAGGHPEALLALVNGTVDAAQINSQTLATAEAEGSFDKSGFRQLWESATIPNDPITVAGDADPAFKQAVKDALLNLPPEAIAEVGAFLDVTPPGPMVEVSKETYQPLFELANTMGLTEEDA